MPDPARARVRAHQRIITRQCRENRGDEPALAEAINTAAEAARKLLSRWPRESDASVIITVEVEYPDADHA